ncbi:hypothetical protein ACYX7E_01625 [Luteimonas sp. RIT-PG2_3]
MNKTSRDPANAIYADLDLASDAWRQCERRLFRNYLQAEWYSTGRHWTDYAPAFHYGHVQALRHAGQRFEDVAPALQAGWADAAGDSRLSWAEALGPVREAWQDAERMQARGARTGSTGTRQ